MIIGIIGKARAGKDTFGLMLAEELFKLTRQRYVLIAYAHEVKMRIQRDFDMSYEQLWGSEKEKSDLRYAKNLKGSSSNPADYWTPREILQKYAEFYKSIDYNFWVRHMFNLIEENEYKNVILTDVRFPNEAVPIIDKGGSLIRVVREADKVEIINGQNHISETSMDDYNNIKFTIENNGMLKDLKSAAKEVAKKLIEEKK